MNLFKLISAVLLLTTIYEVRSIYDKDWLVHKTKYNLNFESSDEELQKLNNFIKNKLLINNHNSAKKVKSFTLKENSRIHFSPSEFKQKFLLKFNVTKVGLSQRVRKPLVNKSNENCMYSQEMTEECYKNWIERGVVGPVEDQLNCGSCYAFTTSNSIASAFSIKTNNFVSLSEQQIIDCTVGNDYGNLGCNGGYLETSFAYAMNVGIVKDTLYPYTSNVTTCKEKQLISNNQQVYKISGFGQTNYFAIDEMKNTIKLRGPAVAYIAASNWNFILYGSGVYDDTTCSNNYQIDHVVLIVGYGTDPKTNQKYWLVKNTWGTEWGENGYIRIARDMNICGVETVFFYPEV